MPAFLRRILYLVIFACIAVPTCSGLPAAENAGAFQLAQEMRDGCVGANLTLMLGMADYFAPVCEARDLVDLELMLNRPGCTWTSGLFHNVTCSAMDIGGETFSMSADLVFLDADGMPVEDPGQAESLTVRFDMFGSGIWSEGDLVCRSDPELGLVLSGSVSSWTPDGCQVVTSFTDVTARQVALADGVSLLFSSGSAELETQEPYATGTAALIGRKAVLALEVGGAVWLGEVLLNP